MDTRSSFNFYLLSDWSKSALLIPFVCLLSFDCSYHIDGDYTLAPKTFLFTSSTYWESVNTGSINQFLLENLIKASSVNTLNSKKKSFYLYSFSEKKLLNFPLFLCLLCGYAPLNYISALLVVICDLQLILSIQFDLICIVSWILCIDLS